MLLKTITAYIQTRRLGNETLWILVIRNEPVGGLTPDLGAVLRAARERLGVATLSVWDCNLGEFTSELTTDPQA